MLDYLYKSICIEMGVGRPWSSGDLTMRGISPKYRGENGFVLYAPCLHKHTQFVGMYSMVGTYYCEDCGTEIEPLELHWLQGQPHVRMAEKNAEKLAFWAATHFMAMVVDQKLFLANYR